MWERWKQSLQSLRMEDLTTWECCSDLCCISVPNLGYIVEKIVHFQVYVTQNNTSALLQTSSRHNEVICMIEKRFLRVLENSFWFSRDLQQDSKYNSPEPDKSVQSIEHCDKFHRVKYKQDSQPSQLVMHTTSNPTLDTTSRQQWTTPTVFYFSQELVFVAPIATYDPRTIYVGSN